MSKYAMNFKRFGLMLLPTFLRKPVIASITYAFLSPIAELFASFTHFRTDKDYRLSHNGQVCYLRAAINDMFDISERRITIDESATNTGMVTLYPREVDKPLMLPVRELGNHIILNRRGFNGINRVDFWITIPLELSQEIDLSRLKGLVNAYKLASKRFAITYK